MLATMRRAAGRLRGTADAVGALGRQTRTKALAPMMRTSDKVLKHHMGTYDVPWELRAEPDEVKGDFGLVALRGGHITERQLENALLGLKAKWRSKEHLITVRDSDKQLLPLNRRPKGSRMGKGVGDNIQWTLKIKAGTVLFDVEFFIKSAVNYHFMTKYFSHIQPLLGVPTVAVPRGKVTDFDDYSYDSARHFLDKNYFRRLQDAYPAEKHKMWYRHELRFRPDAPAWNLKRSTQDWYPLYQAKDQEHRHFHLSNTSR